MFRNADRWKNDGPMSRTEFETRFPDVAACARYRAAKRWPGGFIFPCCHGREGWEIRRERNTWQCTSSPATPTGSRHYNNRRNWGLGAINQPG